MTNKHILRLLWWITALATASLIVFTISLVSVFISQKELGEVSYIKGEAGSVSIRSNPNATSSVVSVIEGGTQVYIQQIIESHGMLWVQVRVGDTIGWMLHTNLSLNPQ